MSDPLVDMAIELVARAGAKTTECNWVPGMVGPECRPSKALRKAMQSREPGSAAPRFARGLSYALAALVGLAILPGLLHRVRTHQPHLGSYISRTPLYASIAAACRLVGYARPDLHWTRTRWGSYLRAPAPLAHLLTIVFFAAGSIAWCFSVRPYYRPAVVWGVSPLGFRAGFFVQGMIPFLFACAQKVNPITWLTTISHERLQVFHQWLARLMLFFAWVHSIAFLWQPYHDGGWSNLAGWFNSKDVYKTGVVCLVLFTVLILSAGRFLRSKRYELFVLQHVLVTCLFLGFYFKHADNEQGCDAWTWAAVGFWALSTLLRWMASLRNSRFGAAKASIEALETTSEGSRLLRIAVRTPVRWAPGQHVFIRFPTLTPLQAHPFTIMSLPTPKGEKSDSEIVIVAKVQGGMTLDLWRRLTTTTTTDEEKQAIEGQNDEKGLSSSPSSSSSLNDGEAKQVSTPQDSPGLSTVPDLLDVQVASPTVPSTKAVRRVGGIEVVRAMVDGPYGVNASMASYDSVLLIVGGVGITFALPILFDLASRCRCSAVAATSLGEARTSKKLSTRRIKLLWSLRDRQMLTAFKPHLDSLAEAFQSSEKQGVMTSYEVEIRLTGDEAEGPTSEKTTTTTTTTTTGRASLGDEVFTFVRTSGSAEGGYEALSVAVGCCGPASMGDVVSQATSAAQWDVLRQRTGSVREIYLANEAFGW